MSLFTRPPITALCLGGGGARGFAHVGALKAFEEAGIKFDICVGTSVGSLVGALYSFGIPTTKMIEFSHALNVKDIHGGSFLFPPSCQKVGEAISPLVGNKNIEEAKIKFAAVAVNLITAKEVILDKGSVTDAVSASCAVPIFFKPLIKDDMHLVDGGLLNNIPADVCRMFGADVVVTVDVNPTRGGGTSELGMLDIIKATFSIMSAKTSESGYRYSDIIIAPDMSKYRSTKKDGYEEMMQRGYEAAHSKIADIKKILNKGVSKFKKPQFARKSN